MDIVTEYNKHPTDLELTIVDDKSQLTLCVHKNVLAKASHYFNKLFNFGIESTYNKITINLTKLNIYVVSDLLMSFYLVHKQQINPPVMDKPNLDRKPGFGFHCLHRLKNGGVISSLFLPEWMYKFEMVRCRIFFGLVDNSELLTNIKVPAEAFEELISVIELVGFNKDTVKIINNNLPENYDVTKLSQELLNKMIRVESNYLIASSDGGSCVKIWNSETGQEIRTFTGHTGGNVWKVAFSSDNKWIVSCGSDKSIKLWDLETGQIIRTFDGHTDKVVSVSFSSDDKWILSCSDDKSIILWDVETAQIIKTFLGHTTPITHASFSTDDKLIASCSYGKRLRLWNVETGQQIRFFRSHADAVRRVLFSSNNKIIISVSRDKFIKIWDVETGQEIKTLMRHLKAIPDVSLSSDNKRIVTCSRDRTVKIWDLESGKVIRTFIGHTQTVWCVSFSPNDKWIVSGDNIDIIKIWNVETGQEIRTLCGHTGGIGQEIRTLSGHTGGIGCVAFSKNKYPNELAKKLVKYL